MKEAFKISELITKKLKGSISPKENLVLEEWVSENAKNKAVLDEVTNDEQLIEKLELYAMFNKEQAWVDINKSLIEDKKIIPIHRLVVRYAAVIIPLLILAYGAYYFLDNYDTVVEAEVVEQIVPGTERATLVLSDGSRLDLESDGAPLEIIRDDIRINNQFKMLKYPEVSGEKVAVYHELITPRGGKYGVVLPDGSEVLLNAGSTLRYPTRFTEDEREVFLDGEAYLKVAKDEKPFIVKSNNMYVSVLGTVFNIEAYLDENVFRTTLVEGKVKVTSNDIDEEQILTPNEQATLNAESEQLIKNPVNVRQYTSWIDGKFEFANDDLETVMKKLSRWYDFDYEFTDPEVRNYHFSARIDDKEDISTILDMLEMTTSVKFEIKDKTILIE